MWNIRGSNPPHNRSNPPSRAAQVPTVYWKSPSPNTRSGRAAVIDAATRPDADFGDASPAWLMSPTAATTTAPGTTGTGGATDGVALDGAAEGTEPEVTVPAQA